ncbi:MAG: M3 family metallopeptidase, partial [Alistipes sp.]|nr:M3 family metallopeptidase [Alistipes sp.]
MKKLLFIMTFSALMAGCGGDEMPVAVLPEIDTSNPLLAEWTTPHATPPFNDIKIEHYEPAIETAIAVSRAEIDAIVNNPAEPTFKNTIVAMERQGALLNRIMGLFYNLREADTSDEMDAIALRVQPKLTALSNDVSLNPQLFERVKTVYEGSRRGLSNVDVKLLEDTYKSFSRSGAALADDKKEEYRKYSSELSEATLIFGQNALAATNAFAINITNPAQVAELPDFVKEGLAAEAKARGEKGWTVTLKAPSYGPFMTYSSQRDIKEKLYRAYNSRALGGEFDNTQIIRNITTLRMKIANLLGYNTHADFTLEERMAESADNVNSFLSELRTSTLEYGRKDYSMINEYAQSKGHKGDVMPWDWAYYTEKYKSEKYAIDDEQVKPYLQLDNVIKGVFLLAEKLYGITFTPAENIQVYHPDVKAYEVYDKKELLAVLYLDFFPRASKSSGAWMTEFRGAKIVDGVETRPLVSLVMNFTKPTETTPSLLTFDEF